MVGDDRQSRSPPPGVRGAEQARARVDLDPDRGRGAVLWRPRSVWRGQWPIIRIPCPVRLPPYFLESGRPAFNPRLWIGSHPQVSGFPAPGPGPICGASGSHRRVLGRQPGPWFHPRCRFPGLRRAPGATYSKISYGNPDLPRKQICELFKKDWYGKGVGSVDA